MKKVILFFLNYNCIAQTHFSIGPLKQEVTRVQGHHESSNKYQALGY